jgi:hypothetical protein
MDIADVREVGRIQGDGWINSAIRGRVYGVNVPSGKRFAAEKQEADEKYDEANLILQHVDLTKE